MDSDLIKTEKDDFMLMQDKPKDYVLSTLPEHCIAEPVIL